MLSAPETSLPLNEAAPSYGRILTHFDLDGVTSAALCAYIFGIRKIDFTGPAAVDAAFVDQQAIVCDLPYPRPCGLWFDHHMSNVENLTLRNIDPASIPGRLADKPSCLRVIYEYFLPDFEIEEWEPLVAEVDAIDGFQFASVEEWRNETPAKMLDAAIRYDTNDSAFLRRLAFWLTETDFRAIAKDPAVLERAGAVRGAEEAQISLITRAARFLDKEEQIILLDLTEYQKPPYFHKALSFVVFPQAIAVLEVRCQYLSGQKSNNLNFSMSLGFANQILRSKKNMGEIMRTLNIGDGHPGAAAGRINCASKAERVKKLEQALQRIVEIWKGQ